MDRRFMQGSWKIAVIMGIPIRMHFSWLIVFGLITWSLSTFYFPQVAPDLPLPSYWIKGVIAALLLFASVAFHELSHSLMARRYSLAIDSITLFIFGGVAQMKGEPPHPKAEFWIALFGPLASMFLSAFFFALSVPSSGGIKALFVYLGQINLFIGLFNLIPGFPMDGGRILRSAIWGKTRNFFYATQKASNIGRKIALFFIFLGVFSLFTRMPGGLWLMLIGWFLYSAAQSSYQQSSLQEVLSGVKVADVMVKEMVFLSPETTIEEAVNQYFLRYGYGGFPVGNREKFLGIITLKEVMDVPREEWTTRRISDKVRPCDASGSVSPQESVFESLEKMITEDKGRLAVMDNGRIAGLITRNGVARYVQMRKEMSR